jgi:hypothetical protein
VAAARAAWRQLAPTLRAADVVFVDECGVATDLTRRYARAPGGRRAPGAVPHGRRRRLTVISGLSLAGLVAPMSIPSACAGSSRPRAAVPAALLATAAMPAQLLHESL